MKPGDIDKLAGKAAGPGGAGLTLGSLFDGSGGFPLAGLLSGIFPAWASEVEPFAVRVATKRLPWMAHYGDIRRLHGGDMEPVDIITFGSPCQDLSVAGKRAGLSGKRSGLFHEAIRTIKEMRKETGNAKPRYIVWENVPGAFSSGGGEDFRSVLEETIRIKEADAEVPPPPAGGWPRADVYLGDGWSVAYRTLDAQYWGVPQRRKRIYLVADLAGGSAGKILFESEGLSGYPAEGFRAWQEAAAAAGSRPGSAGAPCLNAQGGGKHPQLAFGNHPQDARCTGPLDKAGSILSSFGTGGNNQPLVVGGRAEAYGICSHGSNAMLSGNPHTGFYRASASKTVDTRGCSPGCGQGGNAIVAFTQNQRNEVRCLGGKAGALDTTPGAKQQTLLAGIQAVALEGNGSRPSHQGKGFSGSGAMYTLNGTEQHAVASGPAFHGSRNSFFTDFSESPAAGPVMATDYKQPPAVSRCASTPPYTVRRLTPTECARLQGFPDWWCQDLGTESPTPEDIRSWREIFLDSSRAAGKAARAKSDRQITKWLRSPHSDSAEYKLWGNGIALPCAWFVLAGIAWAHQEEKGGAPQGQAENANSEEAHDEGNR